MSEKNENFDTGFVIMGTFWMSDYYVINEHIFSYFLWVSEAQFVLI